LRAVNLDPNIAELSEWGAAHLYLSFQVKDGLVSGRLKMIRSSTTAGTPAPSFENVYTVYKGLETVKKKSRTKAELNGQNRKEKGGWFSLIQGEYC